MQKYPDHLSRGSFNASIAAKWVTWHPIVRRQHQRVVIAPSRITHSQLVKYRGNSGNASTAKGTMMRWTDLVESGKKKRNKSTSMKINTTASNNTPLGSRNIRYHPTTRSLMCKIIGFHNLLLLATTKDTIWKRI